MNLFLNFDTTGLKSWPECSLRLCLLLQSCCSLRCCFETVNCWFVDTMSSSNISSLWYFVPPPKKKVLVLFCFWHGVFWQLSSCSWIVLGWQLLMYNIVKSLGLLILFPMWNSIKFVVSIARSVCGGYLSDLLSQNVQSKCLFAWYQCWCLFSLFVSLFICWAFSLICMTIPELKKIKYFSSKTTKINFENV